MKKKTTFQYNALMVVLGVSFLEKEILQYISLSFFNKMLFESKNKLATLIHRHHSLSSFLFK